MKLADGTYRLSRNVVNPNRNLRNKRDWTCREMFEEGDIFFLRTINHAKTNDSWQELELKGHSRTLSDNFDAFALILFHCEKIEETPSLYLKRRRDDQHALAILDYLAEHNRLSLADLDLAMTDLTEEWNQVEL